jgi:hypothetical protein
MTDTENSERTVYEFEAPTDRTLSGDVKEQDHRDGLLAVGVRIAIAVMAWTISIGGLAEFAMILLGGVFAGTGSERARIMWPSS